MIKPFYELGQSDGSQLHSFHSAIYGTVNQPLHRGLKSYVLLCWLNRSLGLDKILEKKGVSKLEEDESSVYRYFRDGYHH